MLKRERDIHSERKRPIMAGRTKKGWGGDGGGGGGGAWKLKFAQLSKANGVWEVGWVSIQILPGHVNREDRATERECKCEWVSPQSSCVPALQSVGTEMPLSDTNKLSVTSFSLPK